MMKLMGYVCALGALALAGAAQAAPQGKAQQSCINTINKDTINVLAAQAKLGAGCVKDAVKTGSDAEVCMAADAKSKVSSKVTKTSSDETKKCAITPLPEFAYLSAGTAAAAAVQAGKDIVRDVFGDPVSLYLCDTHPAECLCQRQTISRVVGTINAAAKIFVRCKKAALAIGHDPFTTGAASAADIAECVTNASIGLSVAGDPKGAIAKTRGKTVSTLAQFCNNVPNDPFASGQCPGANGPTGADCLRDRALCRFCQLANAADGLGIDCTAFSGTTCP